MSKETQKVKISRLETEVQKLENEKLWWREKAEEYNNELSRVKSTTDQQIYESPTFQKLENENDMLRNALQTQKKLLENADNRYKKEVQRLNEYIQKLENENLKASGNRNGGRKKKLDSQQIEQIINDRNNENLTIKDLSEKYQCSVGTIHNIIKSYPNRSG